MSEPTPRLKLDYFDGRSAAAQTADIWIEAGQLWLQAPLARLSYPVADVRWPERQRHGQRQVLLPDGGVLSCTQSAGAVHWTEVLPVQRRLSIARGPTPIRSATIASRKRSSRWLSAL